MKNKTLKTFAAILVLALVSIVICQFSTASRWKVSDKRWAWIKSRVFSPRQEVDYAIIGSSFAWCAIHPVIISKKMDGASAWNLGRNWDGRDADYFIVKELLAHHHVKNLLLQFYDEERERLHPFALYLISPADALAEAVYYLKHTPITDKEKVKERINTILGYFANLSVRAYRQVLSGEQELGSYYKKTSDELNGFYIEDGSAKQQTAKFAELAGKRWVYHAEDKECLPSGSRSGFYLERIRRLCDEYQVNLYFVVIPLYLHPLPGKKTVDYFSRLGEVLIPDIRAVDDMRFWRNPTHLFKAGSRLFTRELIYLLQRGKEASPFYDYYKK